MGGTQSEIKEDVAEYLFERMKQLQNNFVHVSNYLQKHNERCDVLTTHLVNCESWMRASKDDIMRREVLNVRAELLEEKYTRKMDLQMLEEAEESINLLFLFFEKLGLKLSTKGKDLKNMDANLIASVEQGARDRRTVDLLKQKTQLQEELAEKNDELQRTKDIMKMESQASGSKKDEEFRSYVSQKSAIINDLRAQILKLSEENNKLLSEQLAQTTEKEKNRGRKKDKKETEDKKPQDEQEKVETKSNASSRSSSQARTTRANQQQPPDDKAALEGDDQQNWRGGFRGNRGYRGPQRNAYNQGGRGNYNDRGRGNYQQNANPNYGRGNYQQNANPNYGRGHYNYDGNQQRGNFNQRHFQRGGAGGERVSNPEKDLSPEALLALIKEQQATINEFHSQNRKLHDDNSKLVNHQLAQVMTKKEKAKKKNQSRSTEKQEVHSEILQPVKTQDKEDRIFACDICGQISVDAYSLQIHVAFCGDDQ